MVYRPWGVITPIVSIISIPFGRKSILAEIYKDGKHKIRSIDENIGVIKPL